MAKVFVIGAGPAGMMAAIAARNGGADTSLIEKNPAPGTKLLLTGKGRCNLTNKCSLEEFLPRFFSNGQFLRDAFKSFFVDELMSFFQRRGLSLKVERQQRVFPSTDRSASVLAVLRKELESIKVKTYLKTACRDVLVTDGAVSAIVLDNRKNIPVDRVILATGGISYAFTGSTGDGLVIAKKLGHTIVPARPGLVALKTRQPWVAKLEGLTLHNVRISFRYGGRSLEPEIGEMVFTGSGISGPLVLSASSMIVDLLQSKQAVQAVIDLKPGLSVEQLDSRLLRDLRRAANTQLKNYLKEMLPSRMIPVFLDTIKVSPQIKANQLTAEQRGRIISALKNFSLDISATLPIEEAMVTRGGVCVKEIDPRTMSSRLVKGLYFAGEIIDIDADTGGFNLQAAFSTGYLAGKSAAEELAAHELKSS